MELSSLTALDDVPAFQHDGSSFNFFVEDTSERCYRDVVSCLTKEGWKRVSTYRKRSKVERRRLPAKNLPLLLWTLNEKDLDFADLEPFQLCNHFEGIGQLTTKRGFCELLRDMHWIEQDSHEVSPRCYNLGDPIHREEFIEDFKITASITVLKYVLRTIVKEDGISTSGAIVIPSAMLRLCLNVCSRFLRIKREGEWPGVERTLDCSENDSGQTNIFLTDSTEWHGILEMSYALAAADKDWSLNASEMDAAWGILYRRRPAPHLALRIWLVLKGMQAISKQYDMDGNKNIWVVKAPEACRGLGLKVLHRIEDILECERGMGGRTVQKYVENPLLAPLSTPSMAAVAVVSQMRSPQRGGKRPAPPPPPPAPAAPAPTMSKFDLRVWVLVTSFEPLRAHIFSRVYGRRCGLAYDSSVKSLGESLIHLTNYSIQRKNPDVGDSSSSKASSDPSASSVKKLRNVCDNARGGGAAPAAASAVQGDLLVSHEEILRVVNNHGGQPSDHVWNQHVWPEIKRKILATLEATKGQVSHREKSFEFLGYDIILDDALTPWILEVNMSPAMAHRCPAQNALIASMVQGLLKLAVFPITGSAEKEPDGAFGLEYFAASEGSDSFARISFMRENGDNSDEDEDDASVAAASGEWELLVESAASAEQDHFAPVSRVPASRPTSSYATLRGGGGSHRAVALNEWTDGLTAALPSSFAASRPSRPKSANSTMRPSGGAGGPKATTNNLDVSFAAVGKAVSLRAIEIHDHLCSGFEKLLRVQAWARRCLVRLRLYHENRRVKSTRIQCAIRCFLAKSRRFHAKRARAAIVLQCAARYKAAVQLRIFLRRRRASTKIQTRVRRLLAQRLLVRLRRARAATVIQLWQRRLLDAWRRRAAFKIVIVARRWLLWRRKHARRIFHLVALHYRRRRRAGMQVKRFAVAMLRRYQESRRCYRQWSEMAARKGREWALRAMEKRKAWDMAMKVKLEIIIYNELHALASEIAVEAYSNAITEAAEEEAVAAAAAQEAALAIQAAEEAARARMDSPNGFAAKNYTQLLSQFSLGAASALPFGSLALRAHSSAAEAEGDRGGEDADDDDEDGADEETKDGLVGLRIQANTGGSGNCYPPPRPPRPAPNSSNSANTAEISSLQSMLASFDTKSLALERDMQSQLLRMMEPPPARAVPETCSLLPPPRPKSAAKARPKSATMSKPRFPKDVYGKDFRPSRQGWGGEEGGDEEEGAEEEKEVGKKRAPAKRAASQVAAPAADPVGLAKRTAPLKKSKKKAKPTAVMQWEQEVNSMNPYSFGSTGDSSSRSYWGSSAPHVDDDYAVKSYAASANRLEQERSLLLGQMLNSLLEKHEKREEPASSSNRPSSTSGGRRVHKASYSRF